MQITVTERLVYFGNGWMEMDVWAWKHKQEWDQEA